LATPEKEQEIRHGILYLVPVGVAGLLPFISIPIFTRILTREDYGVLALVMVYAVFASALANFGMTATYERNFFQFQRSPLGTARLMHSTMAFVCLFFILLAGLTYLWRIPLSRLVTGSGEHGNILFWAFCGHFINTINLYPLTFFRNTRRAREFVGYSVAVALITLGVSIFFVAYLRIGVIGIVYGQLCAATAVFLVMYGRFTAAFPFSLSRKVLGDSLKIAYPLTPRVLLGVISTQFDKFMIGMLSTLGGVGIYSIGQKVSYVVFSSMTAIENVFSPRVYSSMFDLAERGGKAIGEYLTPFAYICFFFALAVSLLSEELIFILTPASFHGATDIVCILAMYYALLFFGKVVGKQLLYVKKTSMTSLLTALTVGLNIVLNIPFIMRWGALGAAWATFLTGLISGAAGFVISQRYYRIQWEYKKIGMMLLVFYVATFMALLLRDIHFPYHFRLAVKGVFLLLYLSMGARFGIVTLENLAIVRRSFLGPFFRKVREGSP